jgi:ABC-2 type transport system ATP-binding protein
VITVQGLTRRFGPVVAIDSLDFHLNRGEVVGFLGPNGAGKSTTLRILAGYLPASEGRAEVAGYDVLRDSLEVRKRIGYLPESVPLYGEHRVSEMMEFQARLHGMRRSEYRTRIPQVLERAGISDRSRSIVGRLSRGQRQRVGIAVALLPKPEVLILDEPTSGLDPLQRLEMRKLLRELGNEHTVLISSHILPEIDAVCPRVIILSRGRIAADGSKDDLVRQLGGGSYLRVEAVVGNDLEGAIRMLQAIRGAGTVRQLGRVGIHHVFEIPCQDDLREDVGALAASRGWALRELSWRKPDLEQLFSRIALDLSTGEHGGGAETAVPEPGVAAGIRLEVSPELTTAVAGLESRAAAPGKVVYNLNPFDAGASRDLSKPKAIGESAPGLDEPRHEGGARR